MSNFVAKKATPVSRPKKYKASKCMLHYTTEQTEETVNLLSSDAWLTLETGSSYSKAASVGPVVFDGSVTITQKGKGRKCILTWSPQQYTLRSAEVDPQKFGPIWVQLKPGKERTIEFSGDEAAARELPLAKCHESFKYIKLTMWFKDMEREDGQMAKSEKGVRDHLKVSAPLWLCISCNHKLSFEYLLTQILPLQYLLTGRLSLDSQATEGRSQSQSSVNPASVIQVSQDSSEIGCKMEREKETADEVADEIDDSDNLDAEIISSQQYKEECERVWRQKRREEAEACENYMAAVKQLEELRSRSYNAANKRPSRDG